MNVVKLQSSSGEIFITDIRCVWRSPTIMDMINYSQQHGHNNPDWVVPLTDIDSNTLRRVLAWADFHKNDILSDVEDGFCENRVPEMQPWDVQFFRMDGNRMISLMAAANLLKIKGLLYQACQAMMTTIKNDLFI